MSKDAWSGRLSVNSYSDVSISGTPLAVRECESSCTKKLFAILSCLVDYNYHIQSSIIWALSNHVYIQSYYDWNNFKWQKKWKQSRITRSTLYSHRFPHVLQINEVWRIFLIIICSTCFRHLRSAHSLHLRCVSPRSPLQQRLHL